MKVHVFLFGPVFLICVTAFAQQSPPPGWRQELPSSADPFDVLDIYTRSLDTQWPGSSAPGRQSGNGKATVSLQELQHQHKIPKVALKEYKKGRGDFNKGDTQFAKEHLQNAVNIDPEFADAYNDLGVVIGKLGHIDQAVPEFQKAINLAPTHATALANLSISLYALERYHEACPVARQALKMDPTLLHVRYILALSLIEDRGDKKEALDNLERAAPEFPEARVAASNVLVKIGRREDAARQLEEYLHSTPKEDTIRQQVEAKLAELRQ